MIKIYEKKIEGLKTLSEANFYEHYYKKNARHQSQKSAIRNNLKDDNIPQYLPCSVKLTRIAARKLDVHDNLRMAFKYINICIINIHYMVVTAPLIIIMTIQAHCGII